MTRKKPLIAALLIGAALATTAPQAGAISYSFDAPDSPEYYGSTNYADIYQAEYQYGSINAVDFDIPELPYGLYSNTSLGAMEKVPLPGNTGSPSAGITSLDFGLSSESWISIDTPTSSWISADDLIRADGSIGTLTIPSLGINMKVWEGETTESMAKGLGHYTSTAAWNGNVGICGHNRGAKYVIGNIKDMKAGDTITYTTLQGTRTYKVSFVGIISYTDWSYLQATSDNRITLTTCLADQPTKRVCVQALEIL